MLLYRGCLPLWQQCGLTKGTGALWNSSSVKLLMRRACFEQRARIKIFIHEVIKTEYQNFRPFLSNGNVSHIVPHKQTSCPKIGVLWFSHPKATPDVFGSYWWHCRESSAELGIKTLKSFHPTFLQSIRCQCSLSNEFGIHIVLFLLPLATVGAACWLFLPIMAERSELLIDLFV